MAVVVRGLGVTGVLVLLLWALPLWAQQQAVAKPGASEPCATPQAAVRSLFDSQQPGQKQLGQAVACLDPRGRSPEHLRKSALRLKRLFDSRGLFVQMDQVSNDPDFRDERGVGAAVVHSQLPEVVVAQTPGGSWLWTRASMDYAEAQSLSEGWSPERWARALPDSFQLPLFGVKLWQYAAVAVWILLGLVFRFIVRRIVVSRLQKFARAVGGKGTGEVADAVGGPSATLLMAVVLRLTLPALMLPVSASSAAAIAVRTTLVLSVVWGLYRLVDLLARQMEARAAETDTKLDDQLVPLVRKSLKMFVVLAGALLVLQNLHVDVGSLLTGLGIGGLAFALAAKDTLANFFGSVMIFVDRPFQIGDWIVIEGTEGIVEEVGFRSTRIRTFYNSLVSVPNAIFTNAKIDNYGQREYRRTVTTLNLTYATTPEQIQAFCEGVRAVIAANPFSRKDYYEVHFSGFGAHSLDIMVYFFFRVDSWTRELHERHNVYLEILRLAQSLGIEFAFPTQSLNVEMVKEAEPLPVAPASRMAEVVRAFGPRGELSRPAAPDIVKGGYAVGSVRSGNDDGEG